MCVEIDLRKPPPQFIWVGLFDGFKQPIVYEKLPKYCNGCNIQGHSSVECSKGPLDNPQHQAVVRNQASKNSTLRVRQNAAPNQHPSKVPVMPPSTLPLHSPATTSAPPPIVTVDPPEMSRIHHQTSLHPGTTQVTPSTLLSSNPILSHEPQSNNFPPPPPEKLAPPNPTNPTFTRPTTPHKSTPSSSLRQTDKQQRKSVTFMPLQTNLEANQDFRDAVYRHVALLEQARLKALVANAGNSPIHIRSSEDQTQFPLQIEPQSTPDNDDSRSGSSVAADSQPNSPVAINQDAKNPDD